MDSAIYLAGMLVFGGLMVAGGLVAGAIRELAKALRDR